MRARLTYSTLRIGLAAVALLVLAAAIVAGAVFFKQRETPHYCQVCGAEAIETTWILPGTGVRLFAHHETVATPMSELLTKAHLVSGHEHVWLAPTSVPDPLDPWGPPVVQSLGFVSAPRVVNFMRNLIDAGDSNTVTQWRDLLLRPEYSYVIDGALRFLQAPPDGFPRQQEFDAWWGRNGYALYNRLREETEAD